MMHLQLVLHVLVHAIEVSDHPDDALGMSTHQMIQCQKFDQVRQMLAVEVISFLVVVQL